MRKSFITSLLVLTCIFNNTEVLSAPKRGSRRASSTKKTTISGTYNNKTKTFTQTNISSNVSTTNTTSSTIACGTPASSDNIIAKRLCANAYSEALGKYCTATTCTSALKVAMSMNFGIPLLKNISVDVNGTSCTADNLDKFCSNFADELVSGLWPLYSAQAVRERKTCNFAKAKFNSAQDCFNYVLSEKNNSGLNNLISTSKQTEIDKGIEERCGKDAIIANYNKISIDEWTSSDEDLFFNNTSNAISDIKGIGSNKKLSSSVATQFANVGVANWNIIGKVGNFLDGTWDLKSSSYPRELTVLVNTFITDGETSCGSSFKTDMQDTTFALVDKQSNLEREVAKKGLLKGLYDYSLNQASVFMGEDWAQQKKNDGIIISVQKALDKGKNDILYTSQNKTINTIINSCSSYTETEFKNQKNTILTKIETALSNIEKHKHIQSVFMNSYKSISEDLTTLKTALKSDVEIPTYSFTEESSKDEIKTAIENIKIIIDKLNKTNYICEDGFKPEIDEENITYSITGYKKPTNWDNINTIKALFKSNAVNLIDENNVNNLSDIKEILTIIKNFK